MTSEKLIQPVSELSRMMAELGFRRKPKRKPTGATEATIKRKLAPLIAECVFGSPTAAEVEALEAAMKLYPATGYWRKAHADVMSFTGTVDAGGGKWSFGSWDSMTDCLRSGFEFVDCRGDQRAYVDFECHANEAGRLAIKAGEAE